MADALKVFQPILPAGNGATNVLNFDTLLGASIVRRILITWPAGCGGLVGVRIEAGQGFAFPSDGVNFLSFDDYTYAFDVDNQIDSGQWRMVTYNRDFVVHLVQVVYEYDYLRGVASGSASSQPVSI